VGADPRNEDVGKRLKEVRGPLPAHVFARELDILPSQYHRYEQGELKPPKYLLKRLSKRRGIAIEWVLTGMGPREEPREALKGRPRYREIGERLRALRVPRTQKEFARYLGVPQPQYSRYERGVYKPPRQLLERISEAKGVSIDWILTGKTSIGKKGPDDTDELFERVRRKLAAYDELNVIPRAAVSDDEVAIIKCLRHVSDHDRQGVLREMLDKLVSDPLVPLDEYLGRYVERVNEIATKERPFDSGVDLEGIVRGHEMVKKNTEKSAEKGEGEKGDEQV
jgi:transcriptional regulator with XRE-family HTH domain